MNNEGRAIQKAQGGTVPRHYDNGGFVDALVKEVQQGYFNPTSNAASPPPPQQQVPDPGVVDEIPYDWTSARDLLQSREGYRGETYLDTEGKLTGGHGRLLEGTDYQLGQEIPREVADQWFDEDLATAQSAAAVSYTHLTLPTILLV